MEKDTRESALSTEVQDIIARPPHWLIRWGNAIIVGIMLLLLFVAWLIKLPTKVTMAGTVATVENTEKVSNSDTIATIQSITDPLLYINLKTVASNTQKIEVGQLVLISFLEQTEQLPELATIRAIEVNEAKNAVVLGVEFGESSSEMIREGKVSAEVIIDEERILTKVVKRVLPKVLK
uniref:hypothetical protein n=1 Tax=Fulvivirga sp. TaxID=1931237 RepID=UPI00404A95AF